MNTRFASRQSRPYKNICHHIWTWSIHKIWRFSHPLYSYWRQSQHWWQFSDKLQKFLHHFHSSFQLQQLLLVLHHNLLENLDQHLTRDHIDWTHHSRILDKHNIWEQNTIQWLRSRRKWKAKNLSISYWKLYYLELLQYFFCRIELN